jgi:uncharacterized protein with von Willebrand factor type A (vWA) domain
VPERGQVSQNWDKVNAAADGSRVLLGLLLHGNEGLAQEQLDQMSVDELTDLTTWSEILGTLAYYTKMRKIHEG